MQLVCHGLEMSLQAARGRCWVFESVRGVTRAAMACRLNWPGGRFPAGLGAPRLLSTQVTTVCVNTLEVPLARHLHTLYMMKRTTKYRRTPIALHALGFACAVAAIGTIAVAQDNPVESLATIRGAAETYVKSLIPPNVLESTVTVGQLDSRLRLAHCPANDLSASLPAGMSLQARTTVGVTCSGTTHWTIYVPVAVESRLKVLVLTHAANRDDRLTAADVTVETRKAAGPGNAYLTQPAELAGRAVRHPLAAGTTRRWQRDPGFGRAWDR